MVLTRQGTNLALSIKFALDNRVPQVMTKANKRIRRIIGNIESFFTDNADHSSQLGNIFFSRDKMGSVNIKKFKSCSSRPITRSVMAV